MSTLKKITFLISFVLPVIVVLTNYLGGMFHLVIPLTVFVFLPLLDLGVGKDTSNPGEKDFLSLQNDYYYRALTMIWAFVQLIFIIWAIFEISTNNYSIWEFLMFALSVGIVTGGIGITVGHELGHKASKWEQGLSKLIYMTVCYMHFFIEHNFGHHVHVSTPGDNASSKKGQTFYAFYVKSVFGGYQSAWNIEKKKLQKQGLPAFHYKNEMIWYQVITISFIGFLFTLGSLYRGAIAWDVIVFFLLQSIIAFTLLELTNYIEHYGLERKELFPGKFEKVLPVHSWNQNYLVSNAFLFQLQRHSDHHANAGRRYQALRHFEEAPQLPYGYEVMILIALVPTLWFRMIDPILESWRAKAKSA
ncbi:alkane 1-monooxygenase [Leptospira ognonensis]|uniref:Alkane 1-monooxygenase n=1 Tax=Leptospira ognonensis TaxID=2484945 RepID=A0A4V3JRE1_9LEPT|nr:alkane 1-monooxygenase [Leptospira ognonensis]TGL59645.1 alkane 1-monooxygenase [Leptospira ognonensis]